MGYLRLFVLDQDPTFRENESKTIYKSLDTMGRWRRYSMNHHPDLPQLVEKFLQNHCTVPLDDKGRTIYYAMPIDVFAFEDENGVSFKGGFWSNGAVVAMIDGDSHSLELYIDNDAAMIHDYPKDDYVLNGVFYGD